jgi:hypothetical protein
MIELCSSFVLLTIHRYYIKPDKVNFLVSVTFEVFMYLALYTELINHIDQLRSANSFMKPEERPYLFHEALCLRYFCIAELNMIW